MLFGLFDSRKSEITKILNLSKSLNIRFEKHRTVLLHRYYKIYSGQEEMGTCQIMVNDQLPIERRPKQAVVTHIKVSSEGKGIGKIILLKLAMELALENRLLASYKEDRSDEANYLWDSLIKRRLATEVGDYKVFMDLNDLYSNSQISKFLAEFFPTSDRLE